MLIDARSRVHKKGADTKKGPLASGRVTGAGPWAKTAKPNLARTARAGVDEDFARPIGFAGAPLADEVAQKRFVMTADFEAAVRDFQKAHGLPDTGTIDKDGNVVTFTEGEIEIYHQPWPAVESASA
jgi:hypothetical protein